MRILTALSAAAAMASALAIPLTATASDDAAGYYTYHYDNARTGWNPHETTLNVRAVGSSHFKLIRNLWADSVVYAQPLYAPGVRTASGAHNLAILASENDSVYAYDADSGRLVWHRSFTQPGAGVTAVSRTSVADCPSISPTIGISSTPVIDPATQTLYVVTKIQATNGTNTTYHHQLHALDLRDGNDRTPFAEVRGSVKLADGTALAFLDQRQQNRPGLVLANGSVYVAFGSSCDAIPGSVHGWIFAYDRTTLRNVAIFNTTASSANSYLGSIWQSTYAPAVDGDGDLFFATGNGTFDANADGKDYSDSIVRVTPDLKVVDYFAPSNNLALSVSDQDVGSTGVMLVPASAHSSVPLAVSGHKGGVMYLLQRDRLGGYDAAYNHVLQEIVLEKAQNSLYGGPAYYPGYVYWGAGQQPMQAFALNTGAHPKLTAVAQTPNSFPGEGGEIPAVSSNGTTAGTAVVWATTRAAQGGMIMLYAYDALNVRHMLFAGAAGVWQPEGDAFLTPTVAGGHVFVPGTGYGAAEFGLR